MTRSSYSLGFTLHDLFELTSLESRLLFSVDDLGHGHVDGHRDLDHPTVIREVWNGLDVPATSVPEDPDALTLAATSSLASLPALSSNPGSADTLYLDFDGHYEPIWGAYTDITSPAFDTDGDATTFSGAELTAIEEIWKYVAEDYAPFDINVTTVEPSSFDDGVGLRVSIGGDGAWIGRPGGSAYLDSYNNFIANTVYVFPDNLANGYARYVGDASSHEAGHAFGLMHQTDHVGDTEASEYNRGPGDGRAPIMGDSYLADRGLWWQGTSTSPTSLQDDMAVLTRPSNFGYRIDDHGDFPGDATALTLGDDNQLGTAGLISQISDADSFVFTSAGGDASFSLDVDAPYNNLDAQLELRSADGTLIASAAPTDSFGATLSATLAAGTYYLVAASNGGYGDVGQYSLSGSVVPDIRVDPAWMDDSPQDEEVGYDRVDRFLYGQTLSATASRTGRILTGLFTEAPAQSEGPADWEELAAVLRG